MRDIVDFTIEPIFYCIECDIVVKDGLSLK